MGRFNNQGRGRGRGRSTPGRRGQQSKKQDATKQDISKMLFQIGTAKQASDFTKIKKHCVIHFGKTYKQGTYLVQALEDKQDYDFKAEKPQVFALEPEKGTPEEKAATRSQNEAKKMDCQIEAEA